MSRGWQATAQTQSVGAEPFPDLCRKILLVAATDAEVLDRLRPMLTVLGDCAREIVVVARSSGRMGEIEALGPRVIDFTDARGSGSTVEKAAAVWRLARIIEDEGPDVVHLVGKRPIVLGALAFKLKPGAVHVVVHATGPGPLGVADGWLPRLVRGAGLHMLATILREPTSWLLTESASDLALLRAAGVDPGPRFAILGGMGVDPQTLPALPPPDNAVPVVAFVGDMTRCNGVDLLLQACDRVAGRGLKLALDLCGACDSNEADALEPNALQAWCGHGGGRWHCEIADVCEIWRGADICVLPSRCGGGLPQTLLQAAASARPLIVSDVAGLTDFVRDGVEGLVVPSGDAASLAEALQRLARDPDLRERMGDAARLRVLHGYTHTHLRAALRGAYQSLMSRKMGR